MLLISERNCCSLLRRAACMAWRSVMSDTYATYIGTSLFGMRPSTSRMGTSEPSRRTPVVSRSTPIRASLRRSSSLKSLRAWLRKGSPISSCTLRPCISCAGQPYMRSAPRLNSWIRPWASNTMMASSEVSLMARRRVSFDCSSCTSRRYCARPLAAATRAVPTSVTSVMLKASVLGSCKLLALTLGMGPMKRAAAMPV